MYNRAPLQLCHIFLEKREVSFQTTIAECQCKNHSPVWIPILSFNISLGLCGMTNVLIASSRCSAIDAISPAWLLPFRLGRPEATTYASPVKILHHTFIKMCLLKFAEAICDRTMKPQIWKKSSISSFIGWIFRNYQHMMNGVDNSYCMWCHYIRYQFEVLTNGFNFIHIILSYYAVKQRVQLVQEFHNLNGKIIRLNKWQTTPSTINCARVVAQSTTVTGQCSLKSMC